MNVSLGNKNLHILAIIGFSLSLAAPLALGAEYFDGDVRISGFVRSQIAVSTTSDRNTANAALGKADDPDLNLARVWGLRALEQFT